VREEMLTGVVERHTRTSTWAKWKTEKGMQVQCMIHILISP